MREIPERRLKPHKVTVTTRPDGSIDVSESDFGPSMADQSFAEESDVNYIMRRMLNTGQAPVSRGPGVFADITEISDLMGAFEIVRTAEKMFQDLPSAVRNKFSNNPLVLEEWLANPANRDEAVELGLMKAPPEPVPKRPGDSNESAGKRSGLFKSKKSQIPSSEEEEE